MKVQTMYKITLTKYIKQFIHDNHNKLGILSGTIGVRFMQHTLQYTRTVDQIYRVQGHQVKWPTQQNPHKENTMRTQQKTLNIRISVWVRACVCVCFPLASFVR